MAQSQSPADVHQDELCPTNKRYALMDANKKVDLENPLCLDERRILDSSSILCKKMDQRFHYSLTNPTTMIPYARFTKLIVSHYMTTFPEISRRAHDKYHNVADDVMIKSIFNSGKKEKSHEELEAKQNVEKLKEHLMAKEIEKLVEGSENVKENVKVSSSPIRNNDNPTNLGTREKVEEIEKSRNTPSPTTTSSLRTHSTLISLDTEKL
uniref:Uncharacterized protein n=1 Tax=Tanacetum cinerariifolium TaxID=118510 RepID=A0A6L2M420_TANCI|nr:hypothetical protein [Tanacetum cinerariifolium]